MKSFFATVIHAFRKHPYVLLLIGAISVLAVVNYTNGAFLTGWDNLQTDLSPWLGVKRAWYSVWEEYQSFGLMAGMAHGADLVRALFISILSLFVRQSDVRFVSHFTMVLTGALGMYQLLKLHVSRFFAFCGALFYILNIGSLQLLFLPFEAFTFFLAFLPWKLWIFLRQKRKETRKCLKRQKK